MGIFNGFPGRNDVLNGTNGNDTINGFDGNDVLRGFGGNDRLVGGTKNDFMWGGDGDDYLTGGRGSDTLFGDAGNDHLVGGDNNDKLVGGAGNDHLNGGVARDVLWGLAGDDVFVFDRVPGPYRPEWYQDVVGDFSFGDRAIFNGFNNITVDNVNDQVLSGTGKVLATFQNLAPGEDLFINSHSGTTWEIILV